MHEIRTKAPDSGDPVPLVAHGIASSTTLLCFDEFQVHQNDPHALANFFLFLALANACPTMNRFKCEGTAALSRVSPSLACIGDGCSRRAGHASAFPQALCARLGDGRHIQSSS
eukprot:scaffold78458_cov32-Tisochrysis_lutea.AAC.2